jgi:hypothetical protein
VNCRPSHILYKQLFASKINRKAIPLKKGNRPKHIIINIFFPGFAVDTCGPPKIQNTMMNQTVVPGEYAHFKCQVDMSKCMVAYIDWYHERMDGEGGREKIKNARTRGDPHTHSIQRVHPLHEGLYTCVVGNVLGKAEASAYLQVNSGLPPLSHVPIGLLLLLVPFQMLAR